MQSITLPWPLSKPQTLCTLKRKGGQALPGPGCLRLPLFEEKKWCREIESWCAVHLIQKPTSARNLLGGKSEFVLLNVMFCLSKSFQLGRQSPGRKSNLEPLSHFTRGSESHEKFGGNCWEAGFPEILWPSVQCVWTVFLYSDLSSSTSCWGTWGDYFQLYQESLWVCLSCCSNNQSSYVNINKC